VPIATAPSIAFDGDCAAAATVGEVSDATGGVVTPWTGSPSARGDRAIRSLGGIRCGWSPHTGSGVWVTVIPIAAVEQAIIDDESDGQPFCYGSYVGEDEQGACSFSTTVGDWWYAGVVYTAIGSGIDPTDAVDDLVAAFGTRASMAAAVVPTRPDGAWAAVPDCDTQDDLVDTVPIVGVDLTASPSDNPGEAGPGFYGALTASGQRTCVWGSADQLQSITVELLPAGWWAVENMASRPGATRVHVDGLREAVLVPATASGEPETLYATDGANLAAVHSNYSDRSYTPDELAALAVAVMTTAAS
jgi:hypothetical protein